MNQSYEFVEMAYPVCQNGDNDLSDFCLELSFIVAKTKCGYDPTNDLPQLRRKERRKLDKIIETWQKDIDQTLRSDLSRLMAQTKKLEKLLRETYPTSSEIKLHTVALDGYFLSYYDEKLSDKYWPIVYKALK